MAPFTQESLVSPSVPMDNLVGYSSSLSALENHSAVSVWPLEGFSWQSPWTLSEVMCDLSLSSVFESLTQWLADPSLLVPL